MYDDADASRQRQGIRQLDPPHARSCQPPPRTVSCVISRATARALSRTNLRDPFYVPCGRGGKWCSATRSPPWLRETCHVFLCVLRPYRPWSNHAPCSHLCLRRFACAGDSRGLSSTHSHIRHNSYTISPWAAGGEPVWSCCPSPCRARRRRRPSHPARTRLRGPSESGGARESRKTAAPIFARPFRFCVLLNYSMRWPLRGGWGDARARGAAPHARRRPHTHVKASGAGGASGRQE